MIRFRYVLPALLGLSYLGGAQAREIPVGDFFKDPEFTSVSLSPTGEYITVSVPQGDRTVLAAFRVADMKLVGKWDWGSKQHIDRVQWVNDERFFMYVSEKVGKFDTRVGNVDLYASNVDGSRRADIPNGGTYEIVDVLEDDPDKILVARSVESAYLSKMDVDDGSVRTVASSPLRFGGFIVDHDEKLRYAVGRNEDNQSVVLRREGDDWVEVATAAMGTMERTPLGFAPDNRRVLFSVSEGDAPSRLALIDPETGKAEPISSNPNVDFDDALFSSDGKRLLAVRYLDGLPRYDFVDTTDPEALTYAGLVNAFPDHAVAFNGISDDGRHMLVRTYSDIDPGSYYLFDRQTGKAKFLLSAMSWIKPEEMSPMKPFSLTARDGTQVHGYITVPRGSDGKDLPLILHPHGGPHGPRDEWGFNPEVQFLANRGYAVLQVNFRGSGGYGNAFERAGYGNWGTTMIDDMTDAVDWAIAQGIADKDRICTYGASYGGYAALQSIVRNPTKYKCTIGYVGMYSMDLWMDDSDVAEMDWGRAYQRQVFPESVAGRQAQSPAFHVDRINVPVMLVHGAKDPRVPISQYELLLDKLTEAGKAPEVTVVEDKEGHGFYDYQNQVDLYTTMEAFLDKHIGPAE